MYPFYRHNGNIKEYSVGQEMMISARKYTDEPNFVAASVNGVGTTPWFTIRIYGNIARAYKLDVSQDGDEITVNIYYDTNTPVTTAVFNKYAMKEGAPFMEGILYNKLLNSKQLEDMWFNVRFFTTDTIVINAIAATGVAFA